VAAGKFERKGGADLSKVYNNLRLVGCLCNAYFNNLPTTTVLCGSNLLIFFTPTYANYVTTLVYF
jgi:hypothetical protein